MCKVNKMIVIEQFPSSRIEVFRQAVRNYEIYAIIIQDLLKSGFDEAAYYELKSIGDIDCKIDTWFWMKISEIIIAIDDDKQDIVGVAVLEAYATDETKTKIRDVYIRGIAVKKEYRNQGIGSNLISHVIDFANSINAQTCGVDVAVNNTPAVSLYSKFGLINARYFMVKEL